MISLQSHGWSAQWFKRLSPTSSWHVVRGFSCRSFGVLRASWVIIFECVVWNGSTELLAPPPFAITDRPASCSALVDEDFFGTELAAGCGCLPLMKPHVPSQLSCSFNSFSIAWVHKIFSVMPISFFGMVR